MSLEVVPSTPVGSQLWGHLRPEAQHLPSPSLWLSAQHLHKGPLTSSQAAPGAGNSHRASAPPSQKAPLGWFLGPGTPLSPHTLSLSAWYHGAGAGNPQAYPAGPVLQLRALLPWHLSSPSISTAPHCFGPNSCQNHYSTPWGFISPLISQIVFQPPSHNSY